MDSGYGFKALDPTGATYPDNRRDGSGVMLYALPRPDEKWGPWMDHPNPAEPDGRECGHGRFHIWSSLSLEYGPRNPWPWFVQWEVKIGGDGRKLGVRRLRLRRISPRVLARSLRSPFNWGFGACLSNICLSGANLYAANLYAANLRDADLSDANLRDAIANEYTSWTTDIPDGVTVLQNR